MRQPEPKLGGHRERPFCGECLWVHSEKPRVMVLEDLHWVGPSTIDLISAVACRRAPGKLMLIGTYRPVDATVRQHPLKAVKQDLLQPQLRQQNAQCAEELGAGLTPRLPQRQCSRSCSSSRTA